MLRLTGARAGRSPAHFAGIDVPDARIDIVARRSGTTRCATTERRVERPRAAGAGERDERTSATASVALITGGARGQGASHAERLAAEGARGHHRRRPRRRRARRPPRGCAADGLDVAYRHLDVTYPADWAAPSRAPSARRLDVLVNNAGIIHVNPLLEETLEAWNRLLAVNATGTLLGMQAAIPAMRARGGGSIINVASDLRRHRLRGLHRLHAPARRRSSR